MPLELIPSNNIPILQYNYQLTIHIPLLEILMGMTDYPLAGKLPMVLFILLRITLLSTFQKSAIVLTRDKIDLIFISHRSHLMI